MTRTPEHQNTRTPEHQNTRTPEHLTPHTGNGIGKFLKLCIFIWMLMKIDVGWGQTSQNQNCGTPVFSPSMEYNQTIINHEPSFSSRKIVLYFHYCAMSNESPTISNADVDELIEEVNSDFLGSGISFVWDCNIDYLFGCQPDVSVFEINNHFNGIDVYLFGSEYGKGLGMAEGVGIGKSLFIKGASLQGNIPYFKVPKILSHEIGHLLFLWHTYREQEDPNQQYEFVNQTVACRNLQTTSENGDLKGDFVCDTPAQPYAEAFNSNCIFIPKPPNLTDPQGFPYAPDPYNIMILDGCKQYFTPGQKKRMVSAIEILQHLNNIIVPNEFSISNNLTVNVGEEISFFSDVHVYGQLNVLGKIRMAPDKKIIVFGDLLVDGGEITGFSCGEKWGGIEVKRAFSTSNIEIYGQITIINNANIENAKTFISMVQIPSLAEVVIGGDIHVTNSSIRFCDKKLFLKNKIISFSLPYFNSCTFSNITSKSTITDFPDVEFSDCTFVNFGDHAIELRDGSTTKFYRNIFDGIAKTAIVAFDSKVIAEDNNVFVNSNAGIKLVTTTGAGESSSIINNTFSDLISFGVYGMTLSSSDAVKINNNNFYGGNSGITIEGLANYNAESNTFINNTFSLKFYGTGIGNTQLVTKNTFTSSFKACLTNYQNVSEFTNNCYAANDTDLEVNTGSINYSQGDVESEANNCFSGGIPDILAINNDFF